MIIVFYFLIPSVTIIVCHVSLTMVFILINYEYREDMPLVFNFRTYLTNFGLVLDAKNFKNRFLKDVLKKYC